MSWLRWLAKIPEPPIEKVTTALDRLDGHLECLATALGERRRVQVPVMFERRKRRRMPG